MHRVLVKARYFALQDRDLEKVTGILDWAELLADDMAAGENRTGQFAEHLEGLGEDYPEFSGVFRDYEEGRL